LTWTLGERRHAEELVAEDGALAGYCPGPGLVSAAGGVLTALVFVAAMTLGMKFEHGLTRALSRANPTAPELRGEAARAAPRWEGLIGPSVIPNHARPI
jgi:hypothetical protein